MGEGEMMQGRIEELERRVKWLEWRLAQDGELNHWQDSEKEKKKFAENPILTRGRYFQKSADILKRLHVDMDRYQGKLVIDIGCGPTARCASLRGVRLVGIDPLAQKYKSIPWAVLDVYADLYPYPGETYFDHLCDRAGAVFCINCLDHCADPAMVILNASKYLKAGGDFILSVDCGSEGDEMHPAAKEMTEENIERMIDARGLSIIDHWAGECMEDEKGSARYNWGGGVGMHWFCRKQGASE